MRLPIKHLSARVPWHDRKWDGTVCDNPRDNSFCRVLPMIDADKNVELECSNCQKSLAIWTHCLRVLPKRGVF